MTNYELAENCKKMANAKTVYMWGCYGQKLTKALISKKAAQYPNRFSAARREYLKMLAEENGFYACDCAGLIKNCLWGGFGNRLTYRAKTDFGSESMKKAAEKSGKIATIPEIPGIGVYKKNHVGVYIGNGRVTECTLGSRGDGVVETALRSVAWTDWFYIPGISYSQNVAEKKKPLAKYADAVRKFFKKADIV